jgi:cellulose synthase (UDP-forming)
MYLLIVGNMRRPVHIPVQRAEDAGVLGRVAVISLTVPYSESLEIVRRQLQAISKIRYPHDSWILVDKEHSPEIVELARSLGVHYFSRHDKDKWGEERVASWNRSHPPFKRKTKAGNVNSWLDAHGELYSHYTQLDIDHTPDPSYLDRVLGYFADPKVKWVQAPSVYGNHDSWTARGASEQEFGLQGPLQMGFFGLSRTPFIIGSHCTYDTAGILSIGGFQPTRAEDHLDTVCLAAKGYQGVFIPEVVAVGDGPETFETYLAQQFAWAYSMIEVLLFHTPRLLWRHRRRQAIQFLFVQTWYACWSLSMLILFALPPVSLVLDTPVAHASYIDFIFHSFPVAGMAGVIWYWSRPCITVGVSL